MEAADQKQMDMLLCPLQGITQVLDPCAGKAENLAEFSIANAINGSLNILGAVTPSQDTAFQGTRVNVEFTVFDLKLGPLQTTIPLGWIKPKVCACSCPCVSHRHSHCAHQ